MKAVAPFGDDMEAEINFEIGMGNHAENQYYIE